ncbi:MAG: TonB-dependent receptor [Nitrospirae bacterium]|nr:TonB-dependent receptor [Nitrospirota bacterium]
MRKIYLKTDALLLSLITVISALLFLCPSVYAASEEELQVLRMFYNPEDLVVSPSRSPKPVFQVAENITVITAKEIKEMNAHTLTDVLNTIPGVQMDLRGGPGSGANAHIQGSEFRHVLVTIDGVELNNLSDGFADLSAMPVQHIEKIEIIKGPASSSWGSSLGGVINIITKPAGDKEKPEGALSASFGEGNTQDYRAEASGKGGKVGYYIYAGNLMTDGLTPNTDFDEDNLYAKLKWDVNAKANLVFTFGYNKGDRGDGEYPLFDLSFKDEFEYLLSTLSLNYKVADEADLHISLRTLRQATGFFLRQLSDGAEVAANTLDESNYGGSVKLSLKKEMHNMVVGADFDNGELKSESITDGKQGIEKWAVFVNDTMSYEKFTVTPGVRYDSTSTNSDFLSPSIGITYKLNDKTILRGYAARGFSIPPLFNTFGTGFFFMPNPDLGVEKVWSMQAGIESSDLKYLFYRVNLFRHNISDAIFEEELPDGTFTSVNRDKQRRQGLEIEVKTTPLYNTSFSAGFAYIDVRDTNTGVRLKGSPEYTYDIGIFYNDNKSFSASLKGRYIWWNPEDFDEGKFDSFVWDINLKKRVYKNDRINAELFLSAHNIFNGSQYLLETFRNPLRWVEGGVGLRF